MNWLVANIMAVLLFMAVVFALWILWNVQRSSKIDLIDLLLDTDGKASWTKITAIGAFLFACWIMSYLILHNLMTLGYFLSFLAIYSGAPIAYRLISAWMTAKGLNASPDDTEKTAPAVETVTTTTIHPPEKDK